MPPAIAKHDYDRAAADGYSIKYIPEDEENLIKHDILHLAKLEPLPLNRDEEVHEDEPEEDVDDHVDTDENNGGDMGEQNQQDDEPDESDDDDDTDDETDDEA